MQEHNSDQLESKLAKFLQKKNAELHSKAFRWIVMTVISFPGPNTAICHDKGRAVFISSLSLTCDHTLLFLNKCLIAGYPVFSSELQ